MRTSRLMPPVFNGIRLGLFTMFGDNGKLRGWNGVFFLTILSVNDYLGLLTVDALRSSLTLLFVGLDLCPYS